jgi:hypothetical protein
VEEGKVPDGCLPPTAYCLKELWVGPDIQDGCNKRRPPVDTRFFYREIVQKIQNPGWNVFELTAVPRFSGPPPDPDGLAG